MLIPKQELVVSWERGYEIHLRDLIAKVGKYMKGVVDRDIATPQLKGMPINEEMLEVVRMVDELRGWWHTLDHGDGCIHGGDMEEYFAYLDAKGFTIDIAGNVVKEEE